VELRTGVAKLMTAKYINYQGVALPIYSFPTIGNPSSASTRSVMMALGLVILSLFSGFGVMYLIGLLGINTNNLLWIPVLFTGPAVVFAMFAVVKDEAKREARFRDMSTLVSDALVLATGVELNERDIRRMVEGDVIDIDGGTLRVEDQRNGRSNIMTLIRDEYTDPQEDKLHIHEATVENPTPTTAPETKTEPAATGTTILPVQSKNPDPSTQKHDTPPDVIRKPKLAPVGATSITASK
jgi:hypothetical protein